MSLATISYDVEALKVVSGKPLSSSDRYNIEKFSIAINKLLEGILKKDMGLDLCDWSNTSMQEDDTCVHIENHCTASILGAPQDRQEIILRIDGILNASIDKSELNQLLKEHNLSGPLKSCSISYPGIDEIESDSDYADGRDDGYETEIDSYEGSN